MCCECGVQQFFRHFAAATLSVICNPASTTNPTNQSIIAGQTTTFAVTGGGSLRRINGRTTAAVRFVNISGATNASYTTPPDRSLRAVCSVQCVVSVACGGSPRNLSPRTTHRDVQHGSPHPEPGEPDNWRRSNSHFYNHLRQFQPYLSVAEQ